jgi:hypothetical protein
MGARYLTEDQDPFDHNAWSVIRLEIKLWDLTETRRDHVDLPDDFVERATEITDVHAANPVKPDLAGEYRYAM